MGREKRPGRHTEWRIPWHHIPWHISLATSLLKIVLLIVSVPIISAVACEEEQEHCWNLFLFAQEKLGIRDEYPLLNSPVPSSPGHAQSSCIVRRTFYVCLGEMSRSCRSDLTFRSAYHGLERQLEQLNCSKTGRVFNVSDIPPTPVSQVSSQDKCKYNPSAIEHDTSRGSGEKKRLRNNNPRSRDRNSQRDEEKTEKASRVYDLCALYGDPHLRTLKGEYMTCRLEGVWPLVENNFFTVQVTNRRQNRGYIATSVTEVTVVVKRNECADPDRFLTLLAYSGHLPSVFEEDHSFEAGPNGAVFIDELVPNEHIEIHLSYIDTTIVIRQVSNTFFSVAVKMPQTLVNSTLEMTNEGSIGYSPVQLCMVGCPRPERIDYREILVQSYTPVSSTNRRALRQRDDTVRSLPAMSRDTAADVCQNAHLLDYYLDSCVYDLMLTGDSNYSLAVRLAQSDEFRLVPVLLHIHLNRTRIDMKALDDYIRMYFPTHKSLTSRSAELRSGYITSLFSILILCHLNYIHRTTFVLISSIATGYLFLQRSVIFLN